jgi:acyl-CoA thioester hydrolase
LSAAHEVRLRVRYADTDTMQVVYYANYLVWFETGRIELLRALGLVYRDMEKMGLRIPAVEAHANYKAPARFDDELVVRTWISKVGNTSVRFENEIYKLPERELICTGHTVHVFLGRDGKPTPIPETIRTTIGS